MSGIQLNEVKGNPTEQSYSLITVVLVWCGLVVLSSMYITIPLISVFSASFEVSLQQAALTGSVFSLFYALGCLIFGALSDRFGRKAFLMIGICSITIVTLLIGFVEGFYWLLILRALQGAVASVYAPISLVYVGEVYPSEKRLTTIGFITSGFLTAAIFGQVLSSAIQELWGWPFIFFTLAALYFISSLLVIFVLPREERSSSGVRVWDIFKQMAVLLKNKQLLLTLFITFLSLFSLVAMYTILGSYLSTNTFGLSSQEILAVRAVGIFGIILAPFAGKLSNKYGISNVLRVGMVLATVGVVMVGVFSNLFMIVLMSVVFVAGIALVCPVTISMVSILGEKVRGTAVTFNAFILFVGASLGPVTAIFLIGVSNYSMSFIVLGVFLCIGLIVSMFIKVK
ncbi:MFS transporter [Alkalihalobacterium chitinilyticum]|uniref:MFS transporter n=1 Tax=Alkalihalobacterium chitinilyticum TaxID=2980103 RepID=A0ABT5VDB5_9BACI|nr:MFS transporter [Alkalihalobacterium chitinilyticum]MDE5413436.1 MFS transporter [Alkalihalobacterium chitinilyticum]